MNEEYAIYVIGERYTRKPVYIDYYVYDWNEDKKYPDKEAYIDCSIDTMRDRGNGCFRDLLNMYYDPTELESQVDVVVLESSTDWDYIQERIEWWIKQLKPRYNMIDIIKDIKYWDED